MVAIPLAPVILLIQKVTVRCPAPVRVFWLSVCLFFCILTQMCFSYHLEMMAEDLEKFIEDQKAKLAQDKAELENDPPYMEIRVRVLISFSEFKHVSRVLL